MLHTHHHMLGNADNHDDGDDDRHDGDDHDHDQGDHGISCWWWFVEW